MLVVLGLEGPDRPLENQDDHPVKIRLTSLFRILQHLLVAGATAAITWFSLTAESGPGDPPRWLVTAAVVVLAGGEVANGVRGVTGRRTLSHEKRLDVQACLAGVLVSLDEKTTIPYTELGLTAFVVRRTLRHPGGVQIRIARLRLRANPRPTRILWTKKKGVLGRCWRNLQVEELDHAAKYGKYQNCTKDTWKKLPSDVREGLSYEDFKAIRHFGYVLAAPIIDGEGNYRGCLLVQVRPMYKGELKAGSEAREIICLGATTVAAVLSDH